MTWFGWTFIVLVITSSLIVIGNVGKPRGPIQPGVAAVTVLINGLLVWGAIAVGTTH